MQLRQALLGISNDARGWLKAWALDFTDAEATSSAGTTTNPAAWQLGHIACGEDDVYMLFSGELSTVPEVLRAVCGTGCPAPTASTRYPLVVELWTLLDHTHANLIGLVDQARSDADFDRPAPKENPFFKTLGQGVYEIALHENYHVGEIATLRKALGKKRIG